MKMLGAHARRESNSFGVVRLFAAFAVIVSHAYIVTSGDPTAQPLYKLTGSSLGSHAVIVFFVLSGFLIAESWNRKPELHHFLAGRFARLFPALFVVTLSTIIIAGLSQRQLDFVSFITNTETISLFLRAVIALDGGGTLPGIFTEFPNERMVLSTVWTIRYEVICYFSIPMLAYLGLFRVKKLRLRMLSVLAITAFLVMIRSVQQTETSMIDHMLRFSFAFYLGVASWAFRDRLPLSGLAVAFLFVVTYMLLGSAVSKIFEMLAVGYFTLWLGSINFGSFSRLTNREDLSYGIYLIGYPLQQTANVLWQGSFPVLFNIAFTLLAVVPLAFISWRCIERPGLCYRFRLAEISQKLSLEINAYFVRKNLDQAQ